MLLKKLRSYHGVGDPHVFPGFLTPVLTQLSFRTTDTFITASEVRGENTRERSSPQTGLELTTIWS